MPKAASDTGAREFGETAFSFASDALRNWSNVDGGWLSEAAEAWSSETRRQIEDMSAHNMSAMQQLADCKTPLDIVRVEQEWMTARSKAMFEASVRMATLFADAAKAMAMVPSRGVSK